MSLKSYQDYKSTGVDFYNVAPNHWKVERLSAVAEFQSGKAHEPFISEDGEFICVNSRFVSTRGESVKFCSENLTPTKINDVLMVMSDLPNGRALAKAFYVDNEAPYAVNQRVCRIRAISIEPRFLYYYMDRNPLLLRNDDGLNQTHLSNSDFKNCPIFIPSLEEQKSIVSFLEHETIKIDSLIVEQEKLIELLKEKRQAVISHVVTKGLDSSVNMKDSGIEWIGEIPSHWETKKLKWCVRLLSDKTSRKTNLIALENVESWTGRFIETGLDYEGDGVAFEFNDILFGKLRPYLAKVMLAKKSGEAIGDFYVLRPKEFMLAEFLHAVLLRKELIDLISGASYGSKMPRASWEFIGEMAIAYPTSDEQKSLVSFIKEQNFRLDELTQKARQAINILQERRSALISAAVTGQIDVQDTAIKMEAA